MENIKEYTFTEEELLDIFRDLTCIQDMMSLTNQQDGPVARRIASALKKLRIDEVLEDGKH